ncbi:hypothetical protein L7F22_011538 [Adiantum nelumboides]|nr:hypothetical protein [Adiantum nelumboides]
MSRPIHGMAAVLHPLYKKLALFMDTSLSTLQTNYINKVFSKKEQLAIDAVSYMNSLGPSFVRVVLSQDALLYTAGEDRTIRAWDTRTAELAFAVANAHTNRVRGLCVWPVDKASQIVSYKVASASSDGCVRVWDTRLIKNGDDPSPVMEAETKARLTCLVACSVKKSMVETHINDENRDAVSTSAIDDTAPASTQINYGEDGRTTKRGASTNGEVMEKHISRKKLKKVKVKKLKEKNLKLL